MESITRAEGVEVSRVVAEWCVRAHTRVCMCVSVVQGRAPVLASSLVRWKRG